MTVCVSVPGFAGGEKKQNSYLTGYNAAKKHHSSGKYFTGTFLGGILISPLGAYIVAAISAASTSPEPKYSRISDTSLFSDQLYMKGYRDRARKKNGSSALWGFLTAWAVNAYLWSTYMQE